MSEAPRKEIPLPKGDDDFEDLVLALFCEVWQDPGAKLHGRTESTARLLSYPPFPSSDAFGPS